MGKAAGAVMLAAGALVAIGCISAAVSSPKTADKETGNPKALIIFAVIVGGVLIFFGIIKLIR